MKNITPILVGLFFVFSMKVSAQRLNIPDGEEIGGTYVAYTNIRTHPVRSLIDWSSKHVYIATPATAPSQLAYTAPDGRDIVDVIFKYIGPSSIYVFILLDNGEVELTTIPSSSTIAQSTLALGSEAAKKMKGDDMYVITNYTVFVSHDTCHTWSMDTVGLNRNFIYDIALDTLQNVYLATTNGIYSQPPTGTSWTHNPNFNSVSMIFVDRQNRMFASGRKSLFGGTILWKSSDLGNSFTADTAGIGTLNWNARHICDDAFGNIYAILQTLNPSKGDRIYRSLGGTAPFTRIDLPISALVNDPSKQDIFNDISGDSILTVATDIGIYKSTNQGNTWASENDSILTEVFYGLVRTNTGRFLASNNLGTFYANPPYTTWQKTYPASGYTVGKSLFKDNSGKLYAGGILTDPAQSYNSPHVVVTSIDNGNNWVPDTAGISGIGMVKWFVDETGTQHAAKQFNGAPAGITLYSKPTGASWTLDNSGITFSDFETPTCFGSDNKGTIYFATSLGMIFKRPASGGTWTPDTAGLGRDPVYSFSATSTGTVVASGYTAAHYKSGGVWSTFSSNPSVPSGGNTFFLCVDKSDYVWVAFSHFDPSFNSIGDGVYYTKNLGTTWSPASNNAKTVTFKQLVAIGDSVYGISYFNGIYLFTRSGAASGITSFEGIPNTFALSQNYPNPFNPSTTIHYQLPMSAEATLKIFDLLGREVATLLDEMKQAGYYSVEWKPQLPSGVYFYRLQAGEFVETKKLILLK
jgi:hypothetical protein